jgi:cell division septation protein DedD
MPLTRPSYRIAFTHSPDEVHVVDVMPADQLRAEVEGNRRNLVDPARQGMLLTMLWLYAAARRLDLAPTDQSFDKFVDTLVAWERVKPDNGDEVATVDPTRRAGSSIDSSDSAPASPASTGSQPSSTTPPSSPPATDSSAGTPTPTDVSLGLDLDEVQPL